MRRWVALAKDNHVVIKINFPKNPAAHRPDRTSILADFARFHIFFSEMSEDSRADVFCRRRRRRSCQCLEIFLRLLEALDFEADVIEALPHADVRAVIRRQYEKRTLPSLRQTASPSGGSLTSKSSKTSW